MRRWQFVAGGQGLRTYATRPDEEPKDEKGDVPSKRSHAEKGAEASQSVDRFGSNKPSKAAPGTEELYNTESPLNTSFEDTKSTKIKGQDERDAPPVSKESSELPPLKEGWVRITEAEALQVQKALDKVLEMGIISKTDIARLKEVTKSMETNGIPMELRELLKDDKMFTITKVARLTRIVFEILKQTKDPRQTETNDGQFKSNMDESQPSYLNDKAKSGKKKEQPTGLKWDITTVLVGSFLVSLVWEFVSPRRPSKEITYQEFRSMYLEKGLVEKLQVDANRVSVAVNVDATKNLYPDANVHNDFPFFFSIGSVDSFERNLELVQEDLGIPTSERIPISYSSASPRDMWSLLITFGPTLLLIGGLYYVSSRARGGGGSSGIFGMGKSRAKQFNHETDIKVKFKDVAGMDEAKLEIMEFVSFLKTPEKFEALGAKIPRGAILSGPPGTGKTLLAKATAGESSVPFFSVSGSEFVEMFVGVGASRVRDLFAMARKSTPCIIFIDEIDAIGKSRSGNNYGGNDEREATLNQILTEMDGFNTTEQIVVLAGTNRPDVLDKALMRPGRFDRHIAIDRPTLEGRKQIFQVHLRKIKTHEEMDNLSGRLSALTPGFSGADIANCVNEAALIAARNSASSVSMAHFEQAIERVVGGLEKKSLVLSPEERKTVAYHEAGHAICGWYFEHADPLLKVSIIPRGQGALGYAQYLPAGDVYLMNVNQLMDRMAMTLGGRISEELHFPTVTSGASDDFNKVTRMATSMVTKWGMSKKLGPLHFEDDQNKFQKPFAEATAQMIDSEVSRIIHEAYEQCRNLLTEKKVQVGIVAEELLRKEMLDRNDMIRLLGPRQWETNKDFEKYFGGGQKSAPPPPPNEGQPTLGEAGGLTI